MERVALLVAYDTTPIKERRRAFRLVEQTRGTRMSRSSAIDVATGKELNYPAWLQTIEGVKECVFLQISSSGADIRLNKAEIPADEFDLLLTRKGTCRRRCQLVESNGARLRVQFTRDSASFAFQRMVPTLL